jgi:hypothetical protein
MHNGWYILFVKLSSSFFFSSFRDLYNLCGCDLGRCSKRPNGTVCAMITWRVARAAGQKSALVRQDPEEVRAMHEWWCEKPENKGVDGICLKLDVDHMNEWYVFVVPR